MSNSPRWSKGFLGCHLITATLETNGRMDIKDLRKLLVANRFSNDEASAIFNFMRHAGIVEIKKEDTGFIWSLKGAVFNLR